MRKTSGYGVTVLCCDVEGCLERFNSYSDASIVREQASTSNAGWSRVKRGEVLNNDGNRFGHIARLASTSDKQVDLCPTHRPRRRLTDEKDRVPADVARK